MSGTEVNIFDWFSNVDDFAGVNGVSRTDREMLRFDSKIPVEDQVIQLEAITDEYEPLGDFPSTGIAYPKCISSNAYAALNDMIDPVGTVRAAEIDGARYFLAPGSIPV